MEISFLNQNILIILFGLKLLIKLKRKKKIFYLSQMRRKTIGFGKHTVIS